MFEGICCSCNRYSPKPFTIHDIVVVILVVTIVVNNVDNEEL
jgi:hypothetical protein